MLSLALPWPIWIILRNNLVILIDRLFLVPFLKLYELLSDYQVSRALSDWEKTQNLTEN